MAKTNKLIRRYNSQHFINSATTGADTVYAFIGKETIWGAPDTPPVTIDDNNSTLTTIHSDLLAIKKIPYTDMSYMVKRYNWTTATIYDEFRNDYSATNLSATGASNLDTAKFYVLNSVNRVYKCISNNSGVASTIEPTSVSTGLFQTADGYIWKYLYTISGADMLKFADANWIPVQSDSGVIAAATDGEIGHIYVQNGGSGYPASTTVPVYIEVDGDFTYDATMTAAVSGGAITGLSSLNNNVVSLGNYTPSYTGMPVVFRQITASGIVESATGLINTDATGKVGSVTLVYGGTGYTSGTIQIEQSKATGIATTDASGIITKVVVPNLLGGKNNTTAECRIVSSQGSGFVGVPVIAPKGGHGSNPFSELLCSTVGLSTKLSYPTDAPDVPPDLTFRNYGILLNPITYGTTSTKFTANTGNCLSKIRLTSLTGGTTYTDSIIVYGATSGARAKVVSVTNAGQYVLSLVYLNNYKFVMGEHVHVDATHYGTIDLITLPEVDPRSGDIVYFDFVSPVNRNTSQTETIQVFFNF